MSAIIADNFKLLRVYEDRRYLLFNLSKDISEQNDHHGSRMFARMTIKSVNETDLLVTL